MRSSAASGSHHGDSSPNAPAGCPVVGEEPVERPQHHVQQLVVAAVLGHDRQRLARQGRQRRGLDAAPGHLLQRPVDLVVAQQVGGGDGGLGQVAGEPLGVVGLGQPGRQAGTTRRRGPARR